MNELDIIFGQPLQLAAGAHKDAHGRYCPMNLICVLLGEPPTGYPSCTARPLARMVQVLTDSKAGADGVLPPGRPSWAMFNLALNTVGTTDLPGPATATWMAELLTAPWGATAWARSGEHTEVAAEVAADLLRGAGGGASPQHRRAQLRSKAEKAAWRGRDPVVFAVADAAVYATYNDPIMVAGRLTQAAVARLGAPGAEQFFQHALQRWQSLALAMLKDQEMR